MNIQSLGALKAHEHPITDAICVLVCAEGGADTHPITDRKCELLCAEGCAEGQSPMQCCSMLKGVQCCSVLKGVLKAYHRWPIGSFGGKFSFRRLNRAANPLDETGESELPAMHSREQLQMDLHTHTE